MTPKQSELFYGALFGVLLVSGCADAPKVVSQQLKSWYQIQDSFASVLAETGQLGPSTSIVPVKDFVFPIGTPLNIGTSMPRTTSCEVPRDALMSGPFATLPSITSTTNWGALATGQLALDAGIANLDVDVQQVRRIHLSYADMTFQMIPDAGVDEFYRRSPKCLAAIEGRTVAIVRGYIYGRLRLKSLDFDKAGAGAKLSKVGGLDIRYTDNGEMAIEDEERKPRFVILSKADVSGKCADCLIGVAQLSPNERESATWDLANVERATGAYQDIARGDFERARSREMQAEAERRHRELEASRVGGRRAVTITITP